jgi:hypothetical protein
MCERERAWGPLEVSCHHQKGALRGWRRAHVKKIEDFLRFEEGGGVSH